MTKLVKVKIPAQTVMVNPERWATEFGLDANDLRAVKADVISYCSTAYDEVVKLGCDK